MAEFPHNVIYGDGEADPVRVTVNVQSEYTQVDETALAHAIEEWLLTHVDYVTSTRSERREQLFPVTPIPPAAT
jgi:hypothetical protein